MTQEATIIGLAQWLQTAPGRYLLEWEQQQLDQGVIDLFGFHAVQLGLPALDALRANRMPHRWLATDTPAEPARRPAPRATPVPAPASAPGAPAPLHDVPAPPRTAVLHCDFRALPFPNHSLDVVVLPHTLELTSDPHQALREVERVLVPEGRVVIVGFNPTSLWGLRQRCGRLCRWLSLWRKRPLFLPSEGDAIGYWRLRDWLRLLSFEVERGRFGRYRPPLASQAWLARFGWLESAGERWWPVFGAVYFLVAVKRVRGMRLIGLVRKERKAVPAAPAVITHRHRRQHEELHE